MRSLLEVLKLSSEFLQEKGIANYRREAQDLLSDALNISRVQLYIEHDRPLSDEELSKLRVRLQRRAKGEPGAYIHGSLDFFNCRIRVNPAVLIPRQETEILVDKIIRQLNQEDLANKVLWDICCGSGCIGIAIKKACPALRVIASDISGDALEVARRNSLENGVEVEFLQGDLLEPFEGLKSDYVVCNPPYIAEHEWSALEAEVREHEPRHALISGSTGLEIYQKLSAQLASYLKPHAKVWFEIGADQGKPVRSLFDHKPWKDLALERDWAGKDRFFFLEIE